jgi:hypothetical protein
MGELRGGSLLEKDVEAYLVRLVKKIGGTAYKFTSPARRSVPDRMVLLPGARIYFVEVKTDTGRLTVNQRRELTRLEKLGFPVRVVYGKGEVSKFIEEITSDDTV